MIRAQGGVSFYSGGACTGFPAQGVYRLFIYVYIRLMLVSQAFNYSDPLRSRFTTINFAWPQ